MGYIEEAKQEFKEIKRTKSRFYEMARIEEIGSIFYYINSRDEHNPPHFHFEKKQGKKNTEGRILFEAPEYYNNKNIKATLTSDEAEELYDLFSRKVPGDRFNRTYWVRAIDNWNELPNVRKLPIDLSIPDYRELRP